MLESEDRFNFIAGKKLRFILVNPAMREGINNGTLFIVRYDGRSEVVPAEIAQRIRERDERAIVKLNAGRLRRLMRTTPTRILSFLMI